MSEYPKTLSVVELVLMERQEKSFKQLKDVECSKILNHVLNVTKDFILRMKMNVDQLSRFKTAKNTIRSIM